MSLRGLLLSVILLAVIEWTVAAKSNSSKITDASKTCKNISAALTSLKIQFLTSFSCLTKKFQKVLGKNDVSISVPNHLNVPSLHGSMKYHQSPEPHQPNANRSFDSCENNTPQVPVRPSSETSTMSHVRRRIVQNMDVGIIFIGFICSVSETQANAPSHKFENFSCHRRLNTIPSPEFPLHKLFECLST